jgi:hypothetical protein
VGVARSPKPVRINETTIGDQTNPAVTGLAGGDCLIVWFNKQLNQLSGSRFDADGRRVDQEFVMATPIGSTSRPALGRLRDGRFVLAYDTHESDGDDNLFAQIWTPALEMIGTRPDIRVAALGAGRTTGLR